MAEVPITAGFEDEVAAASRLIRSGNSPSSLQIQNWMQSPCRELQFVAFYCLIERKYLYELGSEASVQSFVVEFLRNSIIEDLSNDFRSGRFDSLLYCRRIVSQESRSGKMFISTQVARMLADLCLSSGKEMREQISDVVLEHVLNNGLAQECFSFWLLSEP